MKSILFPIRDWKMICAASVLLIVVTGAPYLYAYIKTPPGGAYTGLHAMTPGDFNVYFAQMRQAELGTLSTHNLFSGKEGAGSISMANPFWYVLGAAGAAVHLAPPLMFHMVRLLLIPVFLLVLWQLAALMIPAGVRRYAALMVVFSSGVGYLLLPFLAPGVERDGVYVWPADVWVPESNTFLTLYHSPHLLLALILFLFVLVCFLRAYTVVRPFPWQIAGGLAAALLFSFHPFHAISLAILLGTWAVVYGQRVWRRSFDTLFVFLCCAAPSIGWQVGRILTDPITLDWARQNVTPTPPFWALAAGFGLLIPCAAAGFFALKRGAEAPTGGRTHVLLASWMMVHLVLVFLPFSFQRRLLQGIQVPLALLAAVGITTLAVRAPRVVWVRALATAVLWLMLFSSTVGAISRDLVLFAQRDPHVYLSPALTAVLARVEGEREGGIVLAGMTTASFVPAWTERAAYAAPGAHSLGYDVERRVMAYWFLLGKGTEAQRRDFLMREYISDIVITPLDSIDATPLLRDPVLQLKFTQDGVYWFVPTKPNLL